MSVCVYVCAYVFVTGGAGATDHDKRFRASVRAHAPDQVWYMVVGVSVFAFVCRRRRWRRKKKETPCQGLLSVGVPALYAMGREE